MSFFSRYIVPAALMVLAVVNFYDLRWVEGSLYLCVALGFVLMGLLKSGNIQTNIKFWNIVSWVLIMLGLVLFLFVLRMDAYGL